MAEPRASQLRRLADACGILPEYVDAEGQLQRMNGPTRAALIEAMGIDPGRADSVEAAIAEREEREWRRILPPVLVLSRQDAPLTVPINAARPLSDEEWAYCLTREDGSRSEGSLRPADWPVLDAQSIGNTEYRRFGWSLPESECGYHELRLEIGPNTATDGEANGVATTVIVTPAHCYLPAALEQGERLWGPTLQLYSLRSLRNWGMGDYGDLLGSVDFFGRAGAGVVGVGPLHSLYPHEPRHVSPYSPSSRLFWNILYLDIEALPGLADCQRARELLADADFRARIAAARDTDLVDHVSIAAAKREVLEALFEHFRKHDLDSDSAAGISFRRFSEQRGESLRRHALYEALAEHFHQLDPGAWGWPAWPPGYEHPQTEKAQGFETRHRDRVAFFAWLQWLAEGQVAAVGDRSAELGLAAGLYLDLPLGADRGGSEVWAHRDLYANAATIGAPPDAFNLRGQNWGLPPWIPDRLVEARYRPFIELLRANMRHAGALRLDHVMSLMRQFWIPAGMAPEDGGYVRYPLEDLLGILRLESQRNACLVIGEDLGTVPEQLRETLASIDVLSNRLFYFEKQDGHFRPPQDWPRQALVAVSNHDLPTLRGYWRDEDIALRKKHDLFPSRELREQQVVERARDRALILFALSEEELLPEGMPADPTRVPDVEPGLMVAVHRYLARTPSMVLAFQMEDALGITEQTNLPGTTDEHPNWRRKLPLDLEHWGEEAELGALLDGLRSERGTGARARPADSARALVVPRATYRLQLSAEFTFADTERIVPYLARLGISHCYLSPYLKARPHSSHGYDVVDHQSLNPEIGDRAALDSLCAALHDAGMGQIIDVVPNHMAVMGSDNDWWLDVLENGQASPQADYFDIDWHPVQPELRGKVLVPVLGDHYGRVLERGELRVVFAADEGAFAVHYYEHKLPLDPVSYGELLGSDLERLAERLGSDSPEYAEYLSVLRGFEQLPPRQVSGAAQRGERLREAKVGKRRLAELCRRCPPIREQIETRLAVLAGTPGKPDSFERLHRLMEQQAWRVAYWQVAADEINYRRFFDINELAGLSMEQPDVLRDTHALIADLYRKGQVDGLRIDHPDGLYDPAGYFASLQALLEGREPGEAEATAATDTRGLFANPRRSAYVVVEKILAPHEHLREDWAVHGTTGYDFMSLVNGLTVYPDTEKALEQSYRSFTGQNLPFSEQLYRCKRLIIRVHLSSELTTLANLLNQISRSDWQARDFTLNSIRDALTEIAACFPVYRTYVSPRSTASEDREYIDWAVAWAQQRDKTTSPDLYEFIRRLLLLEVPAGLSPVQLARCRRFAMKFQQYTAPVTAKAMEDTCFYRYDRLVSLNEVGGEPSRFGVSVAAFHRQNAERKQRWPHGMLAGSTHDNKRSEDVRARLNVLSEIPSQWHARVRRWRRMNRRWRGSAGEHPAPSRNDEYLFYQSALGVWPLQRPGAEQRARLADRLAGYMRKAVREAKENSSWMRPDQEYEAALEHFVRNSLQADAGETADSSAANAFVGDLEDFASSFGVYGLLNSLSQTALRLTAPGVPDLYQGNELWDFSLVDPDNRRPVDFDHRDRLLGEMEQRLAEKPDGRAGLCAELMHQLADGRAKMYLLRQLLQLRSTQREVFEQGDYLPLTVHGARAEHVCAFARRWGRVTVVVAAGRWFARLQPVDCAEPLPDAARWGDSQIELPAGCGSLRSVFSGREVSAASGSLAVAELLAPLPADVLIDTG